MADDTGEIGREAAESVGFANIKTLGDGPAFYTNLAMGNAVAHQQALNAILAASTGKIVKVLTEVDPLEAVSALKATTGNDLGQVIASLLAALASSQQQTKVAQTTPPVTA